MPRKRTSQKIIILNRQNSWELEIEGNTEDAINLWGKIFGDNFVGD
ncbi:unnamed protein product [marine sediment metagenome]|uniref:Uncharacterized protein n=1 Tax=marine sediment metagenome TaxID=412755 RepID=X1NUC2_9ZZZZ